MFLSCSTLGGLRSTSKDERFLVDQIETLVRVRNAGYSHIEMFMNDRAPWVVDSVVFSIHLPKFLVTYDHEDFARVTSVVFPFIERLGIKVAVLHPPKKTIHESESWREKMLALLELSEDTGCVLTLENVPYVDGIDDYLKNHLRFFEDRAIGITLDLEYTHVNSSDLQNLIETFGPRLLNVHCRDSDGSLVDKTGSRKYLLPGEGSIDFPMVLGRLHDAGYKGPITIEVSHKDKEAIVTAKQTIESILMDLY
ncbi:MAG: sugar phosphate isomerase/epimerase [Candidatus Thorarchaeota archaeon]|nr:sugar phosphate isomerase/epimerase [Candidatus Thorarchaeota archaeon]